MVHNLTKNSDSPTKIYAHGQLDMQAQSQPAWGAEYPPYLQSFDPENIPQLPEMSVQQLNILESQINQEFTSLAHQYLKARLSRLDFLIKNLDSNIASSMASDERWSLFYNMQIQAVEELNQITENIILASAKGLSRLSVDISGEFDKKIKMLMRSMELPLEYDEWFAGDNETLPFQDYFAEIIEYHKEQLSGIRNLRGLHSDWVESITEKNRVSSWKACKLDILERKEELINRTWEELRNLNNEHFSVTPHVSLARADKAYYRSNVPVLHMADLEPGTQVRLEIGNHDTYYDIDNVFYKKNELEISDTKRAALTRSQKFATSNNKHPIPQLESVAVKLEGCQGLSNTEAESDLSILRAHRRQRNKSNPKGAGSHLEPHNEVLADLNDLDHSIDENVLEYQKLLNYNRLPSNIKLETSFN